MPAFIAIILFYLQSLKGLDLLALVQWSWLESLSRYRLIGSIVICSSVIIMPFFDCKRKLRV